MSDLTDFLLARLAEDEAYARMCIRMRQSVGSSGMTARQQAHAGDLFNLVLDDPEAVELVGRFAANGVPAPGEAERVLADVEAKRRIVNRHVSRPTDPPGRADVCMGCAFLAPCPDLRDHAAVYADHPDYESSR